ncbi:ATP-binding protein [Candidatus Parabeggiatoa sp. HSG14]|uniref:AAA family ATPase n=1 Tax=Candidatus Parabeggiatoa sp. HSG14 TaxID=3055593 RepID=UPI0025A8DA4C|nr:ATP-binding protein [Thiotrichales bacterium HSG14]
MLIRFTVENYLSFNQRIDFNMLASDETNHPHHVVENKRKLLRSSLLYGANASGKSNLIKAMAFARDFIVDGVGKHKNIDIKPFKLQEDCIRKPARFEFEFYCMGRAYAYGFVLGTHRVFEEWLFDISQTEEISVFERREGLSTGFNYKHPIFDNISDEDKQRLKFEADGTRDNLLFLTNCKERKIIRFNTIYKWFEDLVVIFPQSKLLSTFAQLNESFFNEILTFFDLGIKRVHFAPIDFDSSREISQSAKEKIKANFPYGEDRAYFVSFEKFNYVIQEKQGNLQASQILTVRENDKHKEIFFELFEESDGTQRLIDLMPMLMTLYQDNTVVVIDELERSLHALLSRKLFDLFLNNPIFKQGHSQLIATTHEVTLLDIKQSFRKDEIWFIEKDETKQSMIYSLAGADVDKLNLVNGYLNGRFGAIPFIRDAETLRM